MRALLLRGAIFALLVWGAVVPRACGDDTVIPAGALCSPGHRYEPVRLVGQDGPRWWGLCYHGKDPAQALANVGHEAVGPTLAKSVDDPEGGCMTCSAEVLEDILFELRWMNRRGTR